MAKITSRLLTAAALVALSLPALAEGPRYSFAEVGCQRIDLDVFNRSVDGDGYSLGGQIEIADSWQAFARYGTAEFDFSIDQDDFALGGGFHGSLSPSSDFVLNLAYIRSEVSNRFGSSDDDGFGLSVGVRNNLTPKIELAGFVSYVDVGDDQFGVTGRAWYFLTDAFAVGANIGVAEDVTRFGIAGRLFFGR